MRKRVMACHELRSGAAYTGVQRKLRDPLGITRPLLVDRERRDRQRGKCDREPRSSDEPPRPRDEQQEQEGLRRYEVDREVVRPDGRLADGSPRDDESRTSVLSNARIEIDRERRKQREERVAASLLRVPDHERT